MGQILDAIEAGGAEHDTVVILSSDHGGSGTRHGDPIDSHLHIPMFIKGKDFTLSDSLFTHCLYDTLPGYLSEFCIL